MLIQRRKDSITKGHRPCLLHPWEPGAPAPVGLLGIQMVGSPGKAELAPSLHPRSWGGAASTGLGWDLHVSLPQENRVETSEQRATLSERWP